jgi:RHS repeat-associated protein
MVYDAFGRLAAEYGGTADPVGTEYLTADHLGSTRLVTSSTGSERRCLDYLPFGEQMTQGMGTRGTCYTSATEPRVKFTGKERDAETGLDYFGARYFSGAQGRFTSPDQINVTKARLLNPSNTLNKYAYAANNPLKFVDPDGNDVTIYYRASRGFFTTDFGHVFIGALNQKTGQVRFLDYWAGSGPPGPGVVNRNMTLDRLREHGSITIQTTPEAAQKVIDQIDKIMANPPDYTLRLSHTGPQGLACTILCQNVLREIGIDLSGAYLPYDVWDEAYRKFSPLFSNFGQWNPGTHTWGPTPVRYQPGRDFGNPRYSGIDYNWLMWSLYIHNNAAPPKACVEVSDSATGTKSKQCE